MGDLLADIEGIVVVCLIGFVLEGEGIGWVGALGGWNIQGSAGFSPLKGDAIEFLAFDYDGGRGDSSV